MSAAIQTTASTLVTMGLVVADADLGRSVNDCLNFGFVKIAGHKGSCVRERTKKNRSTRGSLTPLKKPTCHCLSQTDGDFLFGLCHWPPSSQRSSRVAIRTSRGTTVTICAKCQGK